MKLIENPICCSVCGKKIGLLSERINGKNHTVGQSLICMECLPVALDEAEQNRYKPKVIKRVRDWMKEDI
jgi:hypothetical protein